jgi:MFS family permease
LTRDLHRFYLFRLLATSYLWVPIFVPFMHARGLGFEEIALLHAIYSVVVILVEVPTGALADRIGRRQSMMFGALAMVGACLTAYGAHDFATFAAAEVLAAISMALCSGADSAYLYDLLQRHGRGHEYARREGTASAWHQAGSGLACAAGGWLGTMDLALPYLITAGISAAAFVTALLMRADRPAPARPRAASEELALYLGHMRQSLRDVISSRRLVWIIGYAAVVFVLLRSTVVLYQPYLDSRGFSLAQIGLVYAGSYLVAAIAARRFHAVRRWLGEEPLAYGILAMLVVSFLLLNRFQGGLASMSMLLMQAVANGLYSPLAKTMLNHNIADSSRRATILSIESIARRAATGLFWPVAGLVGASSAMYLCGAIGFAGFVVLSMFASRMMTPMAPATRELPVAIDSAED